MIDSISSMDNGRGIVGMKIGNSTDSQVKALRSQESSVQKQIESIKNGSADIKTKQQLIEPLEEQIQNIEAQIQQLQIENMSKDDSVNDKDSSVKRNKQDVSGNMGGSIELSRDALFFNLSNMYTQIKSANSVRKDMEGKASELKSDAKLDSMTGTGNAYMVKKESHEAASFKGKAIGLESKIGRVNHVLNEKIKSTADKMEELSNNGVNKINDDKKSTDNKIPDSNLKEDDEKQVDTFA
ncbi:FlxA-like family protein [Clostridium sp. JNZ X4-2]